MTQNFRGAFYLLTALFFMWGLITVLVDSLIPRLQEVIELTYFQAGLVQFAFFIAYGLISIPAGAMINEDTVWLWCDQRAFDPEFHDSI